MTGPPRADESLAERDLRARVEATIVIRRGQPLFRRMLLEAYQGRCAVTGTSIPALLEAAHISPYRGDHTDRVDNGRLLRADIHTLFVLHLLTVLPDYTVRLAPQVRTDPYAGCADLMIQRPGRPALRPDPGVLTEHNRSCDWLARDTKRQSSLF